MNLPQDGRESLAGEATIVQGKTAATGQRKTARGGRCLICGRATGDGLRIRGETICSRCEAELVRAQVGTPRYAQFVRRLRRIWPEMSAGE